MTVNRVEDAEKLTIRLPTQKKYTAKVVGTDPQTDLMGFLV